MIFFIYLYAYQREEISGVDDLFELFLQVFNHFVLYSARLLEFGEVCRCHVDQRNELKYFLCVPVVIIVVDLPSHHSFILSFLPFIGPLLLFVLILSALISRLRFLKILRHPSLLIRFLEPHQDLVEQLLDNIGGCIGDVLNLLFGEINAHLLEHLIVEDVPVVYLFVDRVGRGVIMQRH